MRFYYGSFIFICIFNHIYIYNLFITKYSYVHYIQLPCIFNSNTSGPNIKVTKNSLEYSSEVGHQPSIFKDLGFNPSIEKEGREQGRVGGRDDRRKEERMTGFRTLIIIAQSVTCTVEPAGVWSLLSLLFCFVLFSFRLLATI